MYLSMTRFTDNGVQTQGQLELFDQQHNRIFRCDTLELSYKQNQRKISCIKDGVYVVSQNYSFRFGRGFKLQNVLGRDGILIHCGNFNKDTHGCILIGIGYRDINNDNQLDVLNSKLTMTLLLKALKTSTTIEITSTFNAHE